MTLNSATILIFLGICLIYTNSFKWGNRISTIGYKISTKQVINNNLDFTLKSLKNSISMSDEDSDDDEEEEETPTETLSVDTALAPDISNFKEGIKFTSQLNGSDVRVGIIMAKWNADIIEGLYKGVNQSLMEAGVKQSNIFVTYVPGSFELPITARFLAMSKRVDVIVCLGCLIKGETMHFEYIAGATADGLMKVSLDTLVPQIFGVLTVLNKEQAIARSVGEKNEGLSWGKSAVEMGLNRMSAMGMGKSLTKSAADSSSSAFVAFKNGSIPITPKKDESKEKKNNKKFGF